MKRADLIRELEAGGWVLVRLAKHILKKLSV
jgi:hypothetical protein